MLDDRLPPFCRNPFTRGPQLKQKNGSVGQAMLFCRTISPFPFSLSLFSFLFPFFSFLFSLFSFLFSLFSFLFFSFYPLSFPFSVVLFLASFTARILHLKCIKAKKRANQKEVLSTNNPEQSQTEHKVSDKGAGTTFFTRHASETPLTGP